MKAFRRLILRPLRRDVTRTFLTLLSIALGVAVVIAIELSGDAATGSFESSLTTLVGKVDYDITANGGVDERYIGKLATLPVNARFAPVIEGTVVIGGPGYYTTLYGLDAISAPNPGKGSDAILKSAAFVSGDLAERLHLRAGQTIELRGRDRAMNFTIESIVASPNAEWVGIDIAAAQQLLDNYGKLDRIEVFLGAHENPARLERLIRASIPSTWEIETPGARSEENRRMLRAFRWNLRILSYISLLVGAFLIYNTIAVSVVRRRTEIGILRAIGMTSRGVLLLFLGEAAMLGLAGSVLGIALGRFLAASLLGMISRTVNALFVTSAPGKIALAPEIILASLLTGTGVALASALIPALEASRVAPAEAMRRAVVEHQTRLHARRDIAIAAALAFLAIVLCQFGPIGGRPVLGYAATLLAVASAAVLAPAFVTGMVRMLRGLLKRIAGAAGLIAGRSLVSSLARTSVVVTALATAIAMMVAVGVMVGSFRETVELWLDRQLSADIYLRARGPSSAGIYSPIAAPVVGIVRTTTGVANLDILHAFEIRYQGRRVTFGGASTDVIERAHALHFLSGNIDRRQNRAIVSEPFADKFHVHVGDVLRIPLGAKEAALTVTGIYYDYSSDRGFILVDRGTLLKYLPDQPITDIAVYLKSGSDAMRARRELESRLSAYPLTIAPNAVLRRGAVEVFDRTFTVTYALEGVAILVAMLGAANSLLALVLDRRREIGLIRYLGGDQRQVRRIVMTEAGLLGLFAGLLGLALGLALSLVLIYVINKQSFGWTIQFHPPTALIAGALALVWVVTILAAVYPARFAAKFEPVEAIHEE